MKWHSKQPIYIQLQQRITASIIDGSIAEGEALPSVRQLSVDYQINHLTVAKAYQQLVDLDVVEKRRGLGMFVKVGAQQKLLGMEKKKFIEDEWPHIKKTIERLGLDVNELLK
jgi:GntR family transcriptional regulator